MPHIPILAIATILMLPGLAGILLPVLPGLPYMFIVALGFGLVDQFVHLTVNELIILGVIALISFLVDYLAGTLGAKMGGASGKAALAGLLGMVAGTILLPPVGGFLGMFLAVLYVELKHGIPQNAIKAAGASVVGNIVGIGVNLLLGIAFLIAFVIFGLR